MPRRQLAIALAAVIVIAGVALYVLGHFSRGYREDDQTKVQLSNLHQRVARLKPQTGAGFPPDPVNTLLAQGAIKQADAKDAWGNRFAFRCSDSTCKSAILYSFGPNGIDEHGGGDDIATTVQ